MEYSNLKTLVGDDWADFLKPFMCPGADGSCPFDNIAAKIKDLYKLPQEQRPYPTSAQIWRCFKETPLNKVRVVLLGQDPYPKPGYANGLAFATDQKELPPSLLKINDAVARDVYQGNDPHERTGDLTRWTSQGVLLLNAALTIGKIEKNGQWVADPGSHEEIWAPLINFIISNLWQVKRNLFFLAWGNKAKEAVRYEVLKDGMGDNGHGVVKGVNSFHAFLLTYEHPAAAVHRELTDKKTNKDAKVDWLCDHFSKVNLIIRINQLGDPIEW